MFKRVAIWVLRVVVIYFVVSIATGFMCSFLVPNLSYNDAILMEFTALVGAIIVSSVVEMRVK